MVVRANQNSMGPTQVQVGGVLMVVLLWCKVDLGYVVVEMIVRR